MPEMDGYQTMEQIRKNAGLPPPADHRADRQGDEGRPREMPGGRRLRLSGQAGQHRAAAVGAAHVAASLRREDIMLDDKVNILLVDDQPAKLLDLRGHPAGPRREPAQGTSPREALEHLLKTDVAVMLIDVCMPELDGFQLAAMIREHPRFQKTAIIFISAIHADRHRPPARLRDGRGGLCSGAGRPGGAARQGQGVRRALPQDAPARAAQSRAGGARRRAHRRARGLQRAAAGKRAAAQPGAGGRPDGLLGLERRARTTGLGRGPMRDLRRRPAAHSCRPSRACGRSSIPRTSRAASAPSASFRKTPTRFRPSSASGGRTAKCAGASARPRRASTNAAG